MEQEGQANERRRRRHDKELKRQVLAACAEPGASVAAVAMAHGLNANLVHKWRRMAERAAGRSVQKRERGLRARQRCAGSAASGERHPHRTSPRAGFGQRQLATERRQRMRSLDARAAAVIRVDALWLAVEPLDMRAGTESALARVVAVFGAARPHHAYLFANRRANRMKVLVHDGIGVWLAARRLQQRQVRLAQGHGLDADAEPSAVRRARARPAVAAHRRSWRHHAAVGNCRMC